MNTISETAAKFLNLIEEETVLLAVAHGIDKTVIYSASESVVKKVIQDLIDGKPFNEVRGLLGNSVAATNAADPEEALRAEKIEANADYWIELGNPESYLNPLQTL